MALFHGEVHTLATTAGKIIIYTLATTLSSPCNGGNPKLARTGSGRAPLQGQDQADVDEVLSQLEQLVDLLEQYFHPSNNGRSAYCSSCSLISCSSILPLDALSCNAVQSLPLLTLCLTNCKDFLPLLAL